MTRLKTRALGRHGLGVSVVGLGWMGMSMAYGPADEAESIATLHRALTLGVTLLDTAEVHGPSARASRPPLLTTGPAPHHAGLPRPSVQPASDAAGRLLEFPTALQPPPSAASR